MEKQHVGLHKRAAFVYDDEKERKRERKPDMDERDFELLEVLGNSKNIVSIPGYFGGIPQKVSQGAAPNYYGPEPKSVSPNGRGRPGRGHHPGRLQLGWGAVSSEPGASLRHLRKGPGRNTAEKSNLYRPKNGFRAGDGYSAMDE